MARKKKKRSKKATGKTRKKGRKKTRRKAKKSGRKKTRKGRKKTAQSKRRKKSKAKSKKKTKKKAKRSAPRSSRRPKNKATVEKTDLFTNQRVHPRIPLRIKIDYFKDEGVFLYDYSRNLGRGGLFIETEKPMEPGTHLHLSFVLPDQSQNVVVEGRVVWVHQSQPGKELLGVPGMGIQFENPESQHKEALDRFFREIDYDNLSF